MRNKIAIYLSVLAMMFVVSSCFNDDDDTVKNPYAFIKAFSVGEIKSSFPAFNSEGKDTTVVKTISGAAYAFTIDQAEGKVYNNDSLPYAIKLTKVPFDMTVEGVATIYSDESATYEYFSLDDSLDFTAPRKVRVTSLDGTYSKDYTISVNAHQVEPEMMVWKNAGNAVDLIPQKALMHNGEIYVFGKLADGASVVVKSDFVNETSWSYYIRPVLVSSEPLADVDYSTVHLLDGRFYMLAGGDLYVSDNAEVWEPTLQGQNLLAIVGASDADGCIWLANAQNILRTSDGVEYETVSALPKDFPLYNLTTFSYALSHNASITRYMIVGYTSQEQNAVPKVWCLLSNENVWVEYDNEGNAYPCPALENLAVVRYDNFLYAFGGKGNVAGANVEPFSSFYVSKDNGIVWKASENYYQLLPEQLKGKDASFVALTTPDNYMWIITSDAELGVWKGKINRLGFKK